MRRADNLTTFICIGTVFRNKLLNGIEEGEVTGSRGRRRKQLLDDLEDKRGYCILKEEALDLTFLRTGFGKGCGPVVRQTTKWMNVG